MPQHDVQRAPVERKHRVKARFDGAVDGAVSPGFVVHEARAEHRRQGQRYQRRDRNRGGDGQRKLPEQAADDAAHEQERYEHCDQRDADR